MKTIEIEEDLYRYIAAQTMQIGESASDILRRLLFIHSQESPAQIPQITPPKAKVQAKAEAEPTDEKPVVLVAKKDDDLFSLLAQKAVTELGSTVERFVEILATLAQVQGDAFAKVLEVKGRNRVYFATSKEALLAAGSSTNPKALPGSDYWVVTNNNTQKKLTMLKEVTSVLGYQEAEIQQLCELLNPTLD
ncbi:replication initiation negative regulator SeqA [Aliiglaciecola sp. CAU 1673]|uniref:replication initiation negative regulator SeqA n=1 Tax=Aliiglaciecola sp. CAU 1673 TaxID=3032595 RepID=UPI0023DB1F42|nr:replication initiation negative regulator SeqA [Aliiglaciecola sp. CAU 1673]MDF2180022.1 replication initiation negative regulator SeqA [Aliiglaciecola sp. CAU 1673]